MLPELVASRYPDRKLAVTVLGVDFELIADPACRAAFQGIGTNWHLPDQEVYALEEMASAMLRASPGYLKLAGRPEAEASWGQARAAAACRRLLQRDDRAGSPEFGGPPLAVTSRPASARG